MRNFGILATLALAGCVGVSASLPTEGHMYDMTTGATQNAVVRLDLDEVGEDKATDSVSRRHARAEKLLAGMVFGECRGQGKACMLAVGHVAMNRARQDLDVRYGKGLLGVLKKHKAFSCFLKNDPNKKVIDKAMAGKLKADSADAKAWAMAQDVAHTLMHRETKDPTKGSTHYRATYIDAAWQTDRGMRKVTRIAGHVFYKFGA